MPNPHHLSLLHRPLLPRFVASQIDYPNRPGFRSSPMANDLADPCNRCQVLLTIDDLPDDVLLEIFDFYVVRYQDLGLYLGLAEMVFGTQPAIKKIRWWEPLVQVCRRWRGLVYTSPRRLSLQLHCTTRTSARGILDVWPGVLPLLIKGDISETSVDNVIAELKHSDRICQMTLYCHTTRQIEQLWAAMQVPFPELAVLLLFSSGSLPHAVPVLPDSFLGGSAPRLIFLCLSSISFPGFPKLHLSASHLVYLWLVNIPHSGYISPEVMATCLSMLTSLMSLRLEFESPESSPDQEIESRRPPPPNRSVLPALTRFWFKGTNEYSEELVARIDAPRLYQLSAIFFNDIDLDTPELIRFVSRSPTVKAHNKAYVLFDSQTASVKLKSQVSVFEFFQVKISCREPDWQLSSLAQICATSLPLLSSTDDLFICEPLGTQLDWKDGIENVDWLELLLPFAAVKNLYLSKQFAPSFAPALQEIAVGGTTEVTVLPALENFYLEVFRPSESVEEGIERFISARQPTDHPVSISVWEREQGTI